MSRTLAMTTKIAAAVLGVLLLLLLAVVVWVKLVVDAAWLEEKIAAAVGGQREVKVASFDLGLLPPAVDLQGVSIGNPDGFAEGQMLSLGNAGVRLSLLSLLSGPLLVETVEVKNLKVNLIRDRQGRENWKTSQDTMGLAESSGQQPKQGAAAPRQIPQVLVRHANISNLSLHWQDLKNDKAMTVSALNVAWDPELTDYPLQANWNFAVEPEVVSATTKLLSRASLDGNVVRLEEFQINADMTSKHLPEGSGEFSLSASAELDFGSGEAVVNGISLNAPGVSMQGTASMNDEQKVASLDLEIEQLRQVMAMTGLSSILDEPMVSEKLSGALLLKIPEFKMEDGGQTLKLTDFSVRGGGVDLTADVVMSGLTPSSRLPESAMVKVNGHVEDVSPFLTLAAILRNGDGERWRRLADAYKAERRRAVRLDMDLELDGGNFVVRSTEIHAMGIRAMADQLQVEASSNSSSGTLELSVQEIDRLLGAWFGPEAEWVKRFADVLVKADLNQGNQKLEVNLDMLDRLSVPRRFTLQAPMKLDLVANSMVVPQASLLGPGMHLGATMELQLADMNDAASVGIEKATASLEIVKANPRNVIDLFVDTKHADQKLLRHLGGKMQLDLDKGAFSLEIKEAKLDDTSIEGKISGAGGGTEFDIALGKLELDPYIPAGADKKAPAEAEAGNDDTPVLSAGALESISGLKLKGQLSFEELVVKKVRMPELLLELSALDGKLDAKLQSSPFYEGSLSGALALDAGAKPATVSVRTEVSKAALQHLLADVAGKDFVEGSMDLAVDIGSENGTMQQLLQKANGSASLNIGEGRLPHIDLAGKLKSITDISQLFAIGGGSDTKFASVSATVKIENGTAKNEDFSMRSPEIMAASGRGKYDLPNNDLDYTVLLGIGGDNWTLGLPVNITGAPPELSYGLDTSEVGADDLAKILPSMVLGTAGGILEKVLDIGSPKEEPGKEEDKTTDKSESEQLKEKATDAVKKLLPF